MRFPENAVLNGYLYLFFIMKLANNIAFLWQGSPGGALPPC